jgi:S1-C subfamily serine protease
LLPLLARLTVGPIGDALASAMGKLAPASPAASANDPVEIVEEGESVPLFAEAPPRRVARRTAVAASSAKRPAPDPDAGAAPKSGTIVVSAATVTKALEDKKARARDVLDRDGKPFGAKILGVSQYHAGLQDGDIVIEVGGVRVHGASEMTQEGLKQAGGTMITGKILRGEKTYDVTLFLK